MWSFNTFTFLHKRDTIIESNLYGVRKQNTYTLVRVCNDGMGEKSSTRNWETRKYAIKPNEKLVPLLASCLSSAFFHFSVRHWRRGCLLFSYIISFNSKRRILNGTISLQEKSTEGWRDVYFVQ